MRQLKPVEMVGVGTIADDGPGGESTGLWVYAKWADLEPTAAGLGAAGF